MKVYVNDQELNLFSGALVKDALFAYSEEAHESVRKGEKKVMDKWGNTVELNGELSDGQILFVKPYDPLPA
ncbi:MAG: hypothetical protein ACM3SY_15370 [Candidatus Omnitrophota bacterium]